MKQQWYCAGRKAKTKMKKDFRNWRSEDEQNCLPIANCELRLAKLSTVFYEFSPTLFYPWKWDLYEEEEEKDPPTGNWEGLKAPFIPVERQMLTATKRRSKHLLFREEVPMKTSWKNEDYKWDTDEFQIWFTPSKFWPSTRTYRFNASTWLLVVQFYLGGKK